MIADSFPQKYKSRGSGIFSCGIYPGVGLSSFSLVMINRVGWRNGYRYIGIASAIFTAGILFVTEPKRGKFDNQN